MSAMDATEIDPSEFFDEPANVRHSSKSSEQFTPPEIVRPSRAVLGQIDLDPASCEEANGIVKAVHFFTKEDDGFTRPWFGNVFLNPPGGLSDDQQRPVKPKCRLTGACGLAPGHTHGGVESSQRKWWFKLVRELEAGRVASAIFVCFSLELLQTTQSGGPTLAIPLDFPICYPSKRIAYHKPGGGIGKAPPHSSCIVWLSRSPGLFGPIFAHLGRCVFPR
jgi:hypothetical protein